MFLLEVFNMGFEYSARTWQVHKKGGVSGRLGGVSRLQLEEGLYDGSNGRGGPRVCERLLLR